MWYILKKCNNAQENVWNIYMYFHLMPHIVIRQKDIVVSNFCWILLGNYYNFLKNLKLSERLLNVVLNILPHILAFGQILSILKVSCYSMIHKFDLKNELWFRHA